MNIIVVAKNKEIFFSWIKENTRCVAFNKKYGEAFYGNTTYFYAGHDPERLRGLRAEAFVIIEKVSSEMLDQLRLCCFK